VTGANFFTEPAGENVIKLEHSLWPGSSLDALRGKLNSESIAQMVSSLPSEFALILSPAFFFSLMNPISLLQSHSVSHSLSSISTETRQQN
jgi:hypothetical protein